MGAVQMILYHDDLVPLPRGGIGHRQLDPHRTSFVSG
jgi:hypothetical protein